MNTKKILTFVILIFVAISVWSIDTMANTTTNVTYPAPYALSATIQPGSVNDFDPLSDIQVTFSLKTIRSLERTQHLTQTIKTIDQTSEPDFYVIVTINDENFKSPVWRNARFLYNVNWTVTADVPDDQELVTLRIQLFDKNLGFDAPCDISNVYDDSWLRNNDAKISYSIATGQWDGDDVAKAGYWFTDTSGYGRLNGCDDRSFYVSERDCELWFDVTQSDPDGDNIPYWTEVNIFRTDPEQDNTGEDFDADNCPIEWEHKWGHQMWYDDQSSTTHHWWVYDPVSGYDNHSTLDPDKDGLQNVEEYLTSQWGSDPYRRDLFVELDQMEGGSFGRMKQFPEVSKELLNTAFNSRNIVFHLDDGCLGGGEQIPFTTQTLTRDNLTEYYFNYFLHEDLENWRIGVFHYALLLYDAGWAGYVFENGYTDKLDSFQISSKGLEKNTFRNPLYNILRRHTFNIWDQREFVYASALMHELGHTLGIFSGNTPGCDNRNSVYPWKYEYWKYLPYKSVMNYRYIYTELIDYSDGSRGKNDFNDWGFIDLTFFQT
ncbi:MAG: hypothetical protein JXA75_05030 [Candidatus Thermoplasmatota archaeon]|nr:hypothetical protein [Candidatus Thermoplasmatota archaeon]